MRLLPIFLFCLITVVQAQTFTIKGKVKDSSGNENLFGANILIKNLSIGTTTDKNGNFTIKNIPGGKYKIKFSFVGYKSKTITLSVPTAQKIVVKLSPFPILLTETTVKGKKARLRETPVAFSEISYSEIEKELGARYITSELDKLPGVYVSQEGGGFADSRLNIRGYDQTAISVMINGIPINNPENGEIYWSNWADLSDVISSIQVQRGLSASPFSSTPIGGNVNIITTGGLTDNTLLKIKTVLGNYNYRKFSASFAIPFPGKRSHFVGFISRTTSSGYAEQTWLNMITYYFSFSKNFDNQTFEVNLLGSPQEHGQRMSPQTINTWANRGLRYNPDWGYLFGKPITTRDNRFHKPSLTINHNWEINKNFFLSNTIYISYGTGGGHVPPWGGFPHNSAGLIDFNSVWNQNSTNIDSTYSTFLHRSLSALRFTFHKHYWSAFRSTLTYKTGNVLFTSGFDGKFYKAENYSSIDNLLGGDYYIGSGNVNLPSGKMLFVGDKTDYDADSFARSLGVFSQAEYNSSIINAYLNLAVSSTSYDRIDYFNYKNNDPNRETGWKNFFAYRIKGGANYNFSERENIFFNLGLFSRAPLSMNVYTYSNKLYPDVKNEKITSFELGYNYLSDVVELKLNAFYTMWKDKVLNFNIYMPDSYSFFYANVYGAESLHMGIEGEGKIALEKTIFINYSFTYGSYKWLKDVTAFLRPEGNPNQLIKFDSKIKGLYEGNAPMTKLALGFSMKENISKNVKFSFSPNYLFFGRYYANFNPVSRSFNNENNIQSWRIPDFGRIDFHANLSITPTSSILKEISFNFNLFNVLNSKNIVSAYDGNNHSANSAIVWYGSERNGSISVEIKF